MPNLVLRLALVVGLVACAGAGAARAGTDRPMPVQVAQNPMTYTLENNTDRVGGDYNAFNAANWEVCQTACEGDAQCLAWTWVRPGVQGPAARCWVKNTVPPPLPGDCCISGARISVVPTTPPLEVGVDRPGHDYASFDMALDATAYRCAGQCGAEARCVAWTFVMPNVQGPLPRCWLKDQVPAPMPSGCCSSGVK